MRIKKRGAKGQTRMLLTLLIGFFSWSLLSAQSNTIMVKGVVSDTQGEAVISASVVVKGTTIGTVTDMDGRYELEAPDNGVLQFTYIGYTPQEVPINGRTTIDVVFAEDIELLQEVVVIGYGTVRKNDLTGSVTSVGEKEFQKGLVATPGELITGRVAGVQIIANDGAAGAGSRIRIRGGASLNASNDPLIVIDGVPISNDGRSGSPNVLSTINPNDIESMNVLKDASATAIYGSRASNGVIIITTKRGKAGEQLQVEVSSQASIATVAKKMNVLSADQFRTLVKNSPKTEPRHLEMLGDANTDWQDEIFRTALSIDNNVSIRGAAGRMPYRASLSYLDQSGVLMTDHMSRATGSVNLNPKFLDEHLSVDINLKGTYSNNQFADKGAIGAALRMDPTKPVRAPGFDQFSGYWTWLAGGSELPNTMATYNPVALLNSRKDLSDVYRSIANVQFDYKMHFLPELRANINLGYDLYQGKGSVKIPTWAPQTFTNGGEGHGGEASQYKQDSRNLLMEMYLHYAKELKSLNSRIDVMGGYTYQDWKTTEHNFPRFTATGKEISRPVFDHYTKQNTLISYYGRLNYSLLDRYLLTATVRRDGSSRFGKAHRWGTFPSVALAWRINEEGFLKELQMLSNLKMRLGAGVTGQQDGLGDYEHIPTYSISENTAMQQMGDQYFNMWRPNGYDQDRKWEQTATYNVGLDFGLWNNRLSGSVDYYFKKTKDLLNKIPLPAGSNFTNEIVKNIGNLENRGVEASVSAILLDSKDLSWDVGVNMTWNRTRITQLSMNDGPLSDYPGALTGEISGGTGSKIQIHAVGYAPNAFYVFQQLYDAKGKPMEGAYADRNGDGVINEKDYYCYQSAQPDLYLGFNTSFRYKRMTLGTSLRGSFGNYIYNNLNSDAGSLSLVLNPNAYLQNTVGDLVETNFYNQNRYSDYFVENASFVKMDNISFAYDFGEITRGIRLRANASVQNVFVITKYEGTEPEIPDGIDSNFYPNPRRFNVGLSLNF